MSEAGDNRSTPPITPENTLKIFHDCGLGPSEVTPRIRLLADLLSSGRENRQVSGPEFQRSKEARFYANGLLDCLEQEMKWNAQQAHEGRELPEICRAYDGKLGNIADAITSLNGTELLSRAQWAPQSPRLSLRSLVAIHVLGILKESDCENLAFPEREDAHVVKVTTRLLNATSDPPASEVTVRQTIRRLKHGKPTRTQKA